MNNKSKHSKLTGIYLEKFQTIVNPTFIRLDKLAFLYGPNSAGKSSIIDALKIWSNFVGIKEDTDYYSFRGYSTRYTANIHKGYATNRYEMTLGLEYQSGSAWCRRDRNNHQEWWDSPIPDFIDEYAHQELFYEITEKRIQIELGDDGDSIGIAIEGDPLFEIRRDFMYYDNFCKSISDEESEERREQFSDNLIGGAITLYKKNSFFKFFESDIQWFITKRADLSKAQLKANTKSPFYKCLIKENDEAVTIHGIEFNVGRDFSGSNYVTVDRALDFMLEKKYEDLIDEADSYGADKKYLQFLLEHFSSDDYFSPRRQMKKNLTNLAKLIDKIVRGFIYEINDALTYSHVKGSRQTLNSDICFYYDSRKHLKINSYMEADRNYMASYAERLSANTFTKKTNLTPDYLTNSKNISFDFANECLKKYIKSLKDYSIKSLSGKLKLPEGHPSGYMLSERLIDTPIYLCLEFQGKKYGFEDVGSGLSYIFPILTSLNAVNFSVIEQPELHLHPASQCELGDIFLAAQYYGSIALVESHSEHLLLRILRRIRETTDGYLVRNELKATPEDVRIYYFNPLGDGTTEVKEIRIDQYGELLNTWPGGFFSERERELFGERNLRR